MSCAVKRGLRCVRKDVVNPDCLRVGAVQCVVGTPCPPQTKVVDSLSMNLIYLYIYQ
jgi:hypothetical protein